MTQNTENEVHEGHINFKKPSFMHKQMHTQIHQMVVVNVLQAKLTVYMTTSNNLPVKFVSYYIMKINAPCIRSVNLTTAGIYWHRYS